MDTTTLTAKHLQQPLGSFWSEFFSDPVLLDGWTQGLSLQSRQLDQNTKELEQLTGVETTAIDHVELWKIINLKRDLESGSFYPLLFEEDGAVFGAEGAHPLHNKKFNFGDDTDHLGLKPDVLPKEIMFLTDSIHKPTVILVGGVDFDIRNGVVVFLNDITKDPRIQNLATQDTYQNTETYKFWGYYCTYDMKYMAAQWGYLLAYENTSSKEYNRAVWELWKARRFGLTPDIFKEILSIYTQCPRCIDKEETIELLIENKDLSTTLVTNSNVYYLTPSDSPIKEVGATVYQGEFLGTKVAVIEPGKHSFIRECVTPLPEHVDTKLLGDPGYIETNYIRFTAVEAPATIERNQTLDYTPSYAEFSIPQGTFDVTVNKLNRYSQYDFTLEIDARMLPTPGTQVGTLQIYSTSGVPLFSQPFTGNIDAVQGVLTFFTDADDLLREKENALENIVNEVERVVLISMFEDSETYAIRSTLEALQFSDGRRISVTEYPSISVYTELPITGASFSSVTKEHLLNYDLILVNTSSGVLSTLDAEGNTQKGPTLTDEETINMLLANIDSQIAEKNQELSELDNDLTWLLNYVHKGTTPASTSWLRHLVGTRGVPSYGSLQGEIFYKYGGFSELLADDVIEYEKQNKKLDVKFSIPKKPWASSTGLGVTVTDLNTPVYSKRIDISGSTTRLETALPAGAEYVYQVSSLQKKSD